jgi:hypothetical protein
MEGADAVGVAKELGLALALALALTPDKSGWRARIDERTFVRRDKSCVPAANVVYGCACENKQK